MARAANPDTPAEQPALAAVDPSQNQQGGLPASERVGDGSVGGVSGGSTEPSARVRERQRATKAKANATKAAKAAAVSSDRNARAAATTANRTGNSRRQSWDSQPFRHPAVFEKGGARYKYNAKKRILPKRFPPPPPPKSDSSLGDVEEEEEDAKAGDYFEASLQYWKLGTVYYRDTIPAELEDLYKNDMHIVQAVGAANSRWGKPWGL